MIPVVKHAVRNIQLDPEANILGEKFYGCFRFTAKNHVNALGSIRKLEVPLGSLFVTLRWMPPRNIPFTEMPFPG